MANRRFDPVGYRPFRVQPLLSEGLLPVARQGGEFMERVSAGLFRLADEAGVRADAQAAAEARSTVKRDVLAGRPSADIGGTPDDAPIGGNGSARGASFSGPLNGAIERAAAKHGVAAETLKTIAQIESGGNPRAKNPRSSAGGPFQFIDSTAEQFGLADRFDIDQASDAAARLTKANASHLRGVLGREPTPGELYLAHQQGAGGAAKLLKNPDAKATSIVGADAVRLNGGTAGMTAGQFANRWIRKAESGYVMPSAPEQISPDIVTAGGTWRPSGQNTVYGRAYDEEGTRIYVQLVETEMRSTTGQLFERHRDDPVALENAFGELKGAVKKDHIFEEIEADFEVGFGNMAESYLEASRKNLADRLQKEDSAAFLERGSALSTDIQKRIANYDPDVPGAADALASAQAAVDAHYDDAVDRGVMQPDAAAEAKIAARNNTAAGFYLKQADKMDADGIKAMRDNMQADMADGGVEGLDGDGYQSLSVNLEKLENAKRNEAEQLTGDFRARGEAMAARLAAGFDIDQADLSKLMLDSGATPQGETELRETLAKISAGRAIGDMSVRQGEAHVAGLKKQYGQQPTDAQMRTLVFASGMLEAKKKAIATDSVSYAEAQGIVPPTPMLTDAKTADELVEIMGQRTKAATTAAGALETPVRYLKTGEAKAIADAVKADPASGIGLAAGIVAGAGSAANDVLKEFGDDAPMLAGAGAIIAGGGSARAAEDSILGGLKSPDGKAYPEMPTATRVKAGIGKVGGALVGQPDDLRRIETAAGNIARKRVAEAGVENDSSDAEDIYARALDEAAGAVFDRGVQFGGFVETGGGWFKTSYRVLVPSAIRADMFADVIDSLRDEDLVAAGIDARDGKGRPYPAKLFRNAVPVAVQGGFAFAVGDPTSDTPLWVPNADGSPVVLDLVGMRDRLQPRNPGAWR